MASSSLSARKQLLEEVLSARKRWRKGSVPPKPFRVSASQVRFNADFQGNTGEAFLGGGHGFLASVTVISPLREYFERDLQSPSTQKSCVVFEIQLWWNPARIHSKYLRAFLANAAMTTCNAFLLKPGQVM